MVSRGIDRHLEPEEVEWAPRETELWWKAQCWVPESSSLVAPNETLLHSGSDGSVRHPRPNLENAGRRPKHERE